MINYLEGIVKQIDGKKVVVMVNGVGFALATPDIDKCSPEQKVAFFTYLHWNQDKGPSFFGFMNELDRTVFLLLLDCPKIGPSIAITVLSTFSASQVLEAITAQNDKALSSISGIGQKKAEQIITSLKHKVAKLISTGDLAAATEEQGGFTRWQHITEVLSSLNYSRGEVSKTLQYLNENYTDQNYSLDQLIRVSLAYLSQGI